MIACSCTDDTGVSWEGDIASAKAMVVLGSYPGFSSPLRTISLFLPSDR